MAISGIGRTGYPVGYETRRTETNITSKKNVGDSMYIDKEKVQWAQYMNPLGAKLYTAEEMAKMQAELIEKNTATLHKLSDPYSILYKKLVDPEYNGERIFCEYPGGPLYTADEIMEVMNRNLKDAKYQAEARK